MISRQSHSEPWTEPRFGRGRLPIEYEPLTDRNIKRGDEYGPLQFDISARSHRHHLEFLERCHVPTSGLSESLLFPFECWPLPRVLSQCRFGRLNEVISVRATRELLSRPAAAESLLGHVRVHSLKRHSGLCLATFSSTTMRHDHIACMRSTDMVILAHSSDPTSLVESVRSACDSRMTVSADAVSVLAEWTLTMRFTWDNAQWLHNIHTDEYARRLGYERALVEGPSIADIVFAWHLMQLPVTQHPSRYFLRWKYTGPLYVNTRVALAMRADAGIESMTYLLLDVSHGTVGHNLNVLAELEISQ